MSCVQRTHYYYRCLTILTEALQSEALNLTPLLLVVVIPSCGTDSRSTQFQLLPKWTHGTEYKKLPRRPADGSPHRAKSKTEGVHPPLMLRTHSSLWKLLSDGSVYLPHGSAWIKASTGCETRRDPAPASTGDSQKRSHPVSGTPTS